MQSSEANFILHKDFQEKESTPFRVVGGQGVRMVLRSEQMRGRQGGSACKTELSTELLPEVPEASKGVNKTELI